MHKFLNTIEAIRLYAQKNDIRKVELLLVSLNDEFKKIKKQNDKPKLG